MTKYNKQGTLRDILHGTKPQQAYIKKYSTPTKNQSLQLNDLRSMGWQILKALEFLHEKGLAYGNFLTKPQSPSIYCSQGVSTLATS